MYLNDAELKKFDEDGYLFFPKMFSSEEASLLKKEADNVYLQDRKEVVKEFMNQEDESSGCIQQ